MPGQQRVRVKRWEELFKQLYYRQLMSQVAFGKVAFFCIVMHATFLMPSETQVALLCQTAKAHFQCEILRVLDSLGKSG